MLGSIQCTAPFLKPWIIETTTELQNKTEKKNGKKTKKNKSTTEENLRLWEFPQREISTEHKCNDDDDGNVDDDDDVDNYRVQIILS